ncbi:hypothetical protein VPHK479_0097 [Vibrio phage K479]
MSTFIGWEFKIGDIVRLPSNQGKGVVVARKCIEDAEGREFSYSVFNKATEHSTDYLQSELMSVKAMPEV